MDILQRISKAKTSLILEHPFFGAIALNMPTKLDDTIPTACTNGAVVRYNPDFVASLSDGNIVFLVAHECFHPMLGHIWRLMGRDPRKWNIAGDIIINQMLKDEGIGDFIEGGCLDKDLFDKGNGTTDGVYNLLPDDPDGPDGPDGDKGIGQDIGQPEGGEADQEQQEAEWRIKIAQAAQAAKMAGKLSAGMERMVGEVLQHKVRWEDVLHPFVEKCKTEDRTFARPNRRFSTQGLFLPSRTGEVLGECVFFVDCSGSINDQQIAQFNAEVSKVHRDLHPTKLHVIYFDSSVSHHDTFLPNDEVTMQPHGGGGTAFSPLWEFIEDNDIQPVVAIVLTDLCCNDWGDAPDYPVLWVSTELDTAPFGEVVMM